MTTPSPSLLSRAGTRLREAGHAAMIRARQLEAAWHQKRFVGTYVAVTGSCGKTTTTMLVGELLKGFGSVQLGFENAGVLLLRTTRKIVARTDYLVQETSGHKPGATGLTLGAHRIDVAVVTSVGDDHGSSFRNTGLDVPDAIAREKGRLVEAVRRGGLACLNFDDPRVRAMAGRTGETVVGFGLAEGAALRAADIESRWPGRLRFALTVGGKTYRVETRFVGRLMLHNVLAALSVVYGLGLSLEAAIDRLATIEPVRDRLGVHQGRDGKTYILDTEKAPLWSTTMLVDDLRDTAIAGLTLVLGDVSDIRTNTGAQYRKLIRVAAANAATVVLVGRAAEFGARLKADVHNIVVAPTALDVARYLDGMPAGVVLLKANTTLQLWRVMEQVSPVGGLADA